MPGNSRASNSGKKPRPGSKPNDTDEGTQWRGEETNYRGQNSGASDGKKHRETKGLVYPPNAVGRPGNEGGSEHHHDHDNGDRDFETYMCFEQQLVEKDGKWHPRPAVDAPDPRIVGKAMFHFARDLSKMYYRIFIFCQSPDGTNNPNTHITSAHLCAGTSSENGPVIAVLAKIDGEPKEIGKGGQGIKTNGVVINSDINHVTSSSGYTYNTVASIYDGMLGGDVYLNVLGNKQIPDKVAYDEGLLRGQIFHV